MKSLIKIALVHALILMFILNPLVSSCALAQAPSETVKMVVYVTPTQFYNSSREMISISAGETQDYLLQALDNASFIKVDVYADGKELFFYCQTLQSCRRIGREQKISPDEFKAREEALLVSEAKDQQWAYRESWAGAAIGLVVACLIGKPLSTQPPFRLNWDMAAGVKWGSPVQLSWMEVDLRRMEVGTDTVPLSPRMYTLVQRSKATAGLAFVTMSSLAVVGYEIGNQIKEWKAERNSEAVAGHAMQTVEEAKTAHYLLLPVDDLPGTLRNLTYALSAFQ